MTINQQGLHSWGTKSETDFIDGLGMHTGNNSLTRDMNQLQLLLGYKKGIALRWNWGYIHRPEVEEHVDKLIKQLSGKIAKETR